MDEITIDEICLEDEDIRPYYFGTIATDEFPSEMIPSVGLFIINEEPRRLPGSHWIPCQLGLEAPKKCSWMDSFGEKPPAHIVNSLLSQGWSIEFNEQPFQHPMSKQCGNFAIYFLKLWSCGYSSHEILTKFLFDPEKNVFKNDALVQSFIHQSHPLGRTSPITPADILNKKEEES